MKTEYERMLKEFLPALRANAAKRMRSELGMKQARIAACLGTTQAAVSKYLSSKYSERIKSLESGLDRDAVTAFIKMAASGNAYAAQREVCGMCVKTMSRSCSLMIK